MICIFLGFLLIRAEGASIHGDGYFAIQILVPLLIRAEGASIQVGIIKGVFQLVFLLGARQGALKVTGYGAKRSDRIDNDI